MYHVHRGRSCSSDGPDRQDTLSAPWCPAAAAVTSVCQSWTCLDCHCSSGTLVPLECHLSNSQADMWPSDLVQVATYVFIIITHTDLRLLKVHNNYNYSTFVLDIPSLLHPLYMRQQLQKSVQTQSTNALSLFTVSCCCACACACFSQFLSNIYTALTFCLSLPDNYLWQHTLLPPLLLACPTFRPYAQFSFCCSLQIDISEFTIFISIMAWLSCWFSAQLVLKISIRIRH
jgi:uncharacterized protein with PQ loop repeat